MSQVMLANDRRTHRPALVIPAQAGIQCLGLFNHDRWDTLVIHAQAGIQ